MAKVFNWVPRASLSQSEFDKIAHGFLFSADVVPQMARNASAEDLIQLIVTTGVEVEPLTASGDFEVLADDSATEVAIDIATGKFVEGNVICGIALLSEIQNDVRDYVAYNIVGSDLKVFKGVCNSTQSQDYTPTLIAQSRVHKMLTPQQVKTLGL